MYVVQKGRCINPLNKDNHPSSKELSDFPTSLKRSYPLIPENAKICSNCRRQLYKQESELPASKRTKIECDNEYHRAGVAVLEQLKRKFSESVTKQDRIQLLTFAPEFWSRRDLMREFGCTEWEARTSKQLVEKNGIFSIPDKKTGKVLPTETVNLIKCFYERDDISRMMPGLKDVLSIKQENGKREHVQKRLLLADLHEIYSLFKKEHADVKVGLTKFTQLKPPNCVLAGSSGTHNVCVCVHHENVKLMLNSIDLQNLTKDTRIFLENYHDCIREIVCDNAVSDCYLGECLDCPNMRKLRKHLLECFNSKNISEIKYESWFQSDRSTIGSKTVNIYEFMNVLGDKLIKLKTHDYFAREQFIFVEELKKSLQKGEFLISCDFAENYAFVIQNSTQSFHWNNNQASIFTVVIYYRENDDLKHLSMAIISENLNHDTISVYEYQKIIISYLKSHFTVSKIYYITDGAGQHFKNKSNFYNLLFHEKDFGIPAKWHFHATAHGKGACDGIGANLKRGARRASLQLSSKSHILTPEDLYEWANKFCKETKVFYTTKESYEQTVSQLKPRLDKAQSIPGTLNYHAIIPVDEFTLKLKKTSLRSQYQLFPKKITGQKKKINTLKTPLKVTPLKVTAKLGNTKKIKKSGTATKNVKNSEKIKPTKPARRTAQARRPAR